MSSSYVTPKFQVEPGQKMPPDTVSTEAWPIKSMITFPAPNARVKGSDRLTVRGRAWVGEGSVDRVEISLDEGVSWQRARLASRGDKYAWRTFTFEFQPQRFGYQTFLARVSPDTQTRPGVALRVGFDLRRLHVFDKTTEATLL